MNKRGNMPVILGFILFAGIMLFAAFAIAVGSGVITYASSEITNITTSLGVAGDSNLSAISETTFGNLNTSVQMLKWFSGIIIAFMMIGILIFAGAIRLMPSKVLIGAYILMVMLLVFTSIYISNMYEDIKASDDILGNELDGMPLASWLIIYMPSLLTFIAFIGGIIIFTGINQEDLF